MAGPRIPDGQPMSARTLHRLMYPTAELPALERKRVPFTKWITTPRPRIGRVPQRDTESCHDAVHYAHAA